jgi:hypothetical protein
MNYCLFVCSLLWVGVLRFAAFFMSLCLLSSASHMNDRLGVCRFHECVSSCISHERSSSCLQPLTSSCLLYLSETSHYKHPPVCSLSWTVVLLSAASHEWLACILADSDGWLSSCLQPLTSGSLVWSDCGTWGRWVPFIWYQQNNTANTNWAPGLPGAPTFCL